MHNTWFAVATMVLLPWMDQRGVTDMASPSQLSKDVCASDDDVTFGARTAFGEARGEPFVGKVAVVYTLKTRRESKGRWPNSIKGVGLQRFQFSCYDDGPHLPPVLDPENSHDVKAWGECLRAASAVLCGRVPNPAPGANHYLTKKLYDSPKCPSWAKKMAVVAVIGGHIFLKG